MIAILDYQAGNQTSVARALAHLGIPCAITADPETLASASGVIFPGVGAAGQAMNYLREHRLDVLLGALVSQKKPLLGICLGCQILLESSEESGGTPMLDIMPGRCRRFDAQLKEEDGTPVRIPHMGWNTLHSRAQTQLLDGIAEQAQFYFVHSYYVETREELVLASTHYGLDFCSVYGRDGLWAVQFHPEKSGEPGLQLLKNFFAYSTRGSHAQ